MANGILKGLAVAAGTGLAMGFTSARSRTRVRIVSGPRIIPMPPPSAEPVESDDELLDIEPLLDRVERLEYRLEAIVAPATLPHQPARVPEDFAEAIAALERRVEENTRDLALLREQITQAEKRAAGSVAAVRQSIEQTRAEVPAIVERHISTRIDDLQRRFSAEIEQSQQHTLEMFESVIEEKISSRIGSIERALAEQAGSIQSLNSRATETDNNLQRLVTAIEKLCERSQLIPLPPTPRGPFESQLDDAMKREPVVPVVRTQEPVPPPAFTGIENKAQKKSFFSFRGVIVAGLGLLASRFWA